MAGSWALISLTEIISSLARGDDEVDVVNAVERAAETLDAEIAAICTPTAVTYSRGFGRLETPDDELLAIGLDTSRTAVFDGVGELFVARAAIDGTQETLVLARSADAFTADEHAFLRAVGRVIGFSSRIISSLESERAARQDLQQRMDENRRLLGQLRERQGLLDRLFRIQQSISHRAPTQDILDAVSIGAFDLLGVGRVNLRLRDTESPDDLVMVSSRGYEPDEIELIRVVGIDSLSGQCLREERLIVSEGDEAGRVRLLADDAAMMAAPVHVNGEVVGALTVSSVVATRRFSAPEQEALLAFAEHASLALQDAQAIESMRNALNRERHRAEHDPLTGLPNRISIQRHLDQRIADAGGASTAVLFVDLDRFKLTNDTLGHAFGDEVLTVVADRLRTSVREHDLVGRLSGDEFVVVCEGMSEVGAIELAERIQTIIRRPIAGVSAANSAPETRGEDYVITASVGIAGAVQGDTAEQVVANADLAMYRAKQTGRSRIEVFDLEFRESLEARISVGRDLRRALQAGELVVHLQPIVRLPERRVIGFEALARWQHPSRGLVMPDDFIPMAEDSGLVAEVDRAIIEETLRLLAASGIERSVAVNLSARTFGDPSLVSWLMARLSFYNVSPDLLIVEVTETVLMESTGAAARQLEAIRALGIAVMIDDFGTGYSSLAYLQTFDVDGVKIDRSFTALLEDDPRASAIVAAVLHMAEALDLVVVVEGIELDAQVDHVVQLRDRSGAVELQGQGYLFGRPSPGEARLASFLEVPRSAGPRPG